MSRGIATHARRIAIAVGVLLLCVGGGTAATVSQQSDEATASTVVTVGGVLNPPATGPTYARLASALRVAWTPPSTGLTPQRYEVWRRDPAGSYPASALGTSTLSPYDDTSVVQCNKYYYKLRSVYENMRSLYSSEQLVQYDTIPPNVTASAIVATSGPAPIAHWVKPLGEYYVYITVNDNCLSDQSGITMAADLRNLGELGSTTSMTFGSYTPVAGGSTYNFRAGPFTAISLVDGTQPAWTVEATDPVGNAKTFTGATVTVDGVSPTSVRTPQIAATLTNYYAPELGYGEIRKNAGYRVYAELTDARSGVPSSNGVTSDTSNVTLTGATASPLPGGTYQTDNGVTSWNFRSGVLTSCNGPSPCPADGAVPGFSVTATDAVGNAVTVGDQTGTSVAKVEIDNAGLTLDNCNASSVGGDNNRLDGSIPNPSTNPPTAWDRNVLAFNDTVDPEGLAMGWTGVTATLAGNAHLSDGSLFLITADYLWMDYLTLFRDGTDGDNGAGQNFGLGGGTWMEDGIIAPLTYRSDFTRNSRSQFTLRYWNASRAPTLYPVSGTMQLGALTDAAGNGLTSASVTCLLTGW